MVKDELNITVGARIRTIRENMGYTRERFSDLCDISDSFLSDVERGNKSLRHCTKSAVRPMHLPITFFLGNPRLRHRRKVNEIRKAST